MNSTTPLILSLRPHFADLVFSGLKKAELRRRFARYVENREVFIYATSPEQALRGGFRVDQVWEGEPEEIWEKVSTLAAIDKSGFDDYYRGSKVAYALSIADVWQFESPVCLWEMRNELDSFVVPQSWRYARDNETRFLHNMRHEGRILIQSG